MKYIRCEIDGREMARLLVPSLYALQRSVEASKRAAARFKRAGRSARRLARVLAWFAKIIK